MALYHRLKLLPEVVQRMVTTHELYENVDWNMASDDETMGRDFREETDDLAAAVVVGSAHKVSDSWTGFTSREYHRPMLDLDFPAAVIPSSTEGHCHLYIDRDLTWEQYEKLLDVMAEIGLLEAGYVAASKARGRTFLRLPWIKKGREHELAEEPSLEEVQAFLARGPKAPPAPDPWASNDPMPF